MLVLRYLSYRVLFYCSRKHSSFSFHFPTYPSNRITTQIFLLLQQLQRKFYCSCTENNDCFCCSYQVFFLGCSTCYDKVLLLWRLHQRKIKKTITAAVTDKDPFDVVKVVGIYHFILLFPVLLLSFSNTIPRYSIPSIHSIFSFVLKISFFVHN